MHWTTKLKLIGALVGVVLTVIVVVQNTEPVETYILFWSPELPRAVLLSLTFIFGVAVGLGLAYVLARKAKHEEAVD